ncbi:MAG: AAA family ATPase [Candidatus Syntrophoarchaeum sp.]|nr:AAA family ATPase [Candidatus Syntrophoarchaeum sp.]
MIIDKLDISEFRGIKKCEEELEFSKFTILIGQNNSGKTAILEAIYLMQEKTKKDPFFENYRSYIVQTMHAGSPSSLIYGYDGVANIQYSSGGNSLLLKIDRNGNSDFFMEDKQWQGTEEDYSRLSQILRIKSYPEDIVRSFDYNILFIPTKIDIRSLIAIIKKEAERMTKVGAHRSIIKLINECVNDNFTEIILETMRVRKEINDNAMYIKLEDLGQGLVKTIPPLLWIETYKPKLLLWDDFETSAHPTLIRNLIKWLSEKDMQVIMSTHSIDVLSEFLEESPKDATVLQLSKTHEDILHHKKLSLEELEVIMEKGAHDPRRLAGALQL